jgi:P4 family phage/plasmid primase-like protien
VENHITAGLPAQEKTEAPQAAEPEQASVPRVRPYRVLNHGSKAEIAEWLLGTIGSPEKEDFGALADLVYTQGALWRCDADNVWRQFDESEAYALIERFDGAMYPTPDMKRRCVQMSADFARGVVRIIELKCGRPGFFANAATGLAFRNGFLRIASDGTSALEALTPEHHVTRMLPFDYDPAPSPEAFAQWKAFLTSCWGSSGPNGSPDVESMHLLHEMIGYLLSGANWAQKIFLLLGPPRCGKGTICKLLLRMFGSDAGGNFKVAGLDNNFALESMLGKSLCVDGDVRRGKGAGRDEGKIVERLLGITAADPQEVPRKNKTALHLVLPTRLVIASNPPFSVRDVGSALSTRILVVPFSQSYLGEEDTQLEAKLAAELPAIVALAMQALPGLYQRGRFVEPRAARELRDEIESGESPVRDFFEDWCAFEDGASTDAALLYDGMRQWATANGNAAMSHASLGAELRKRGVRQNRPRTEGGRRGRVYYGVRLLPARAEGLAADAGACAKVVPISRARSR